VTLLLVGFVVTLTFAPVVRRVMLSVGILDSPNARSSHTQVTPRGGGLAVLAGVCCATAAAVVLGSAIPWGVIAGACALAVLGLADDRASVPPLARLAVQVVVGALVGASIGGVQDAVLGAVVIPAAVNVVNFMDGINGISALHGTLWGLAALAIGGWHGHSQLATLGAVTAGSLLGFLPWNAPRAKLFLGDSGSYLLGGLIGGGLLLSVGPHHPTNGWVVVAPLTLYLADTAAVLSRRAVQHKPLLQAHREHVYQLLSNECGLSHTTVALAVTTVNAAIAVAWWFGPRWLALVVTVAAVLVYLSSPSWATRARSSSRMVLP